MATAQRPPKIKKGKKVTPATAQQIEGSDRPSSALSHNSWVENLDRPSSSASLSVPTPSEVTAVTELPRSGSVLSVREAVEEDRVSNIDENEFDIPPPPTRPESTSGSRPATPVISRPHTPTTPAGRQRTLSPTAGMRSRSVSPMAKRRAKVTPTDGLVDVEVENRRDVAEPVQAWSDTSSVADMRALSPDNTRPQSKSQVAPARTRSPGTGMHAGSAPSMHSLISVQEAADGNRIDGIAAVEERAMVLSRSKSVASLRNQRNQEDTKSIASTTSSRLKPPQIANEQQAYVPFMYARDCLAKVMDDMGKMKQNHIRIVGLIEDSYRKIEDETQGQFNVFVVGMRDQYKEKVKTFRQVIHIHQEDFGRHKEYWQETLDSLNSRNKALMKDKKRLLVINKIEIDRLEKEKDQVTTELSQRIDQEHESYLNTKEKLEQSNQELKILQDQFTTEKDETTQLNARLQAATTGGAVITTADSSSAELLEENENLKEEIEELKVSLSDAGGHGGTVAMETTAVLAATTAASEEEKKRLKDERNEMQEQRIQAQKELAIMRAKYDALHVQYTLVAAAASSSDESKEKMQVELDSVQKDKELISEESNQLNQEIQQWKVEFEERTGREPTDDDKTESVKELEIQLAEVDNKQVELDTKCSVMKALQDGQVPELMEQPAVPEPIIKTVEVTVTDPAIAAALEVSQRQCEELRAKVTSLEKTVKDKTKTIKKLEKNRTATTVVKSAPVVNAAPDNDRDLKLLLKTLVNNARSILFDVSDNADSMLKERLANAKEASDSHQDSLADAKQAVALWEEQYRQEQGNSPDESDRDEAATQLYATYDECSKQARQNELDVAAWSMLGEGNIPDGFKVSQSVAVAPPAAVGAIGAVSNNEDTSDLEDRIVELEEEILQLEDKVKTLEEEKSALESSSHQKSFDALLDDSQLDDDDDVEGFSAQLSVIRAQVDEAEKKLAEEQEHHETTKAELEDVKQQYENLLEEKENVDEDTERKVNTATVALKAELEMKDKSLEEIKQRIDELEQEKLKDVPVDTVKEIKNLKEKLRIIVLEKETLQKDRIGGGAEIEKLRADNAALTEKLRKEKANNIKSQEAFTKKLSEKEKKSKDQLAALEKKYLGREAETKKQITSLEKKIKELNASGGGGGGASKGTAGGKGAAKVDAKTEKKLQLYQEQVASLKKQIQEEQNKTKAVKDEFKEFKSAGAGDKQAGKKIEKQMKELEKKYDMEQKKYEREHKKATELEAELKTTSKDLETSNDENKKLQNQINSLGVAAAEALELKEKVDGMVVEIKTLKSENKTLNENYNSERVLRKKYYNQIEDMKGKIRVYCRGRPLSGSEKERGNYEIVKAPDEYTIQVDSGARGVKEFQFDHIFLAGSTQEDIFEDTNNLIQSAVDGYNVCIFAYGQTGSGKTFTMIGDKAQSFPGIAPRAFNRIFEIMEESKSKFSFKVSTYMLELYNEKLIDLYAHGKSGDTAKLDIKKDQKGMVFINGSIVQEAANAKELYGLFDAGSLNRHVASTKMNSESSRSHLIIGIIIESTNLSTGTVVKGKLSLVDLAGSERAAKTGATAEQLKEANSINKSLSALGDVISALSSEQSFIPYRNNKLTMLMQDSLGGNAKTLMFVNISPADYNAEETVVSLTYASRVKLITNDASKNADNKEIARLKKVIEKLKSGEDVAADDDVE